MKSHSAGLACAISFSKLAKTSVYGLAYTCIHFEDWMMSFICCAAFGKMCVCFTPCDILIGFDIF